MLDNVGTLCPMQCTHIQCSDWRMLKYLVVPLFVFSELRWQMIVCFVDIGGIVDHHCLDFLFIIEIVFQTEINFHYTK